MGDDEQSVNLPLRVITEADLGKSIDLLLYGSL